MSLWAKLRLVRPSVRRAAERDMQDELASLRELAAPGELGNLTLVAEDVRAAWTWRWLEEIRQDARYAWRSMLHARTFTAMAVVSLALGIGANTAIYSFIEALLLRPLPVADPDTLVILKWRAQKYTSAATNGFSMSTGGTHRDPAGGWIGTQFPYEALSVFEQSSDVLANAFGYFVAGGLNVTVDGSTEVARGHYVSGGYFEGIGVMPAAGRHIVPSDDRVGAEIVVMVSDGYARRRFGSPQFAAGRTIRLNNKPVTIAGVTPAGFFGVEPGSVPDLFIPLRAKRAVDDTRSSANTIVPMPDNPGYYWIEIVGRLAPGVTRQQAGTLLAPRFQQFVDETVTRAEDRTDLPSLLVAPGAGGLDSMRRRYSTPMYVLVGMVGLILVIACANLANLLLARATVRRREIAVRLSMGASRARLVRQMLTESLLLSFLGGLFGLIVAWWSIGAITALLANGREYFTLHAELNWRVLSVTTLLSLATGILFGLAPALQATRADVLPALKQVRTGVLTSAARPGHRRFAVGHALIIVQIALSLVLLVAAGLFGGTLANLQTIPVGFDRDDLLLFTVRPAAAGYRGAATTRVLEDLRQKLLAAPGVLEGSLSSRALPTGGGTTVPVHPVPAISASTLRPSAGLLSVGPGFFRTMRIPVVAGREFDERDAGPTLTAAVVNRRLVADLGLASPVGARIALGASNEAPVEIVGVVGDALFLNLKDEQRPMVYFSYLQGQAPGQMTFEIRTAGEPMGLAPTVREIVREHDHRLAVSEMKTQATHIEQTINQEIALARLCSAFAALALLIACVGLYGTVAFNVNHRVAEIGIRMALGASSAAVVWLILKSVILLEVVGLLLGVPLVLAGSRYIGSLLFGIAPTNPTVMISGVALLLLSGLIAGYLPARRALAIDPMAALRNE